MIWSFVSLYIHDCMEATVQMDFNSYTFRHICHILCRFGTEVHVHNTNLKLCCVRFAFVTETTIGFYRMIDIL